MNTLIKNFKEAQTLDEVSKFHRLFSLPILERPQIPTAARCALRVSLLREELEELEEAIDKNDLVGVADAFCDIQYVLSGAILEFGLGTLFKDLFDEVQRSNMSKTCNTMQEAEKAQEFYRKEKNTESYIEKRDGQYLVYRKEDGKVLKSVDYSAPNLKNILANTPDF